ncbi:MAG: plastocyanin/azurin family copper-binding protein [Robiginitomaculum sp.]|nr:plastocyanin/azurin family copper-binding protein [Robiginitomaculum sp.]MDQ7078441.1 plastocyanin/azurin family copper-binding protein [Robiginitomaculum sp.]
MQSIRLSTVTKNTSPYRTFPRLVLLAACSTLWLTASQAWAGDATKTVMMNDAMKFVPASVTIHAGDTVEWKNGSVLIHTVTADASLASDTANVHLPAGATPFNSGNIEAKGTFSHTFTTPGTYKYFCIPHEGVGMVGEVVVQP